MLSDYLINNAIEKIKANALTNQAHQNYINKLNSAKETAPHCPRCKNIMVLRQARKTNRSFWGCSRYPHCKAIININ